MNPRFLNLGTRYRWVVSFVPGNLPPAKRTASSNLKETDVPQSRFERYEKEKNLSPLSGNEPRFLDTPERKPSLYWLSYSGSFIKNYFRKTEFLWYKFDSTGSEPSWRVAYSVWQRAKWLRFPLSCRRATDWNVTPPTILIAYGCDVAITQTEFGNLALLCVWTLSVVHHEALLSRPRNPQESGHERCA
jgi:hypothetical protein